MILIGFELQIACVQKQLPNPLTHNAQSFLIQTVQSTRTFFGLIIFFFLTLKSTHFLSKSFFEDLFYFHLLYDVLYIVVTIYLHLSFLILNEVSNIFCLDEPNLFLLLLPLLVKFLIPTFLQNIYRIFLLPLQV